MGTSVCQSGFLEPQHYRLNGLLRPCLIPEIFAVHYLPVKTPILNSVITCPHCKATEALEIPEGSSQQFYRCPSCSGILKTKSGDCCIFCSYGNVDCSSSEQNLAA
ncbi:GDCCVxC domain-containing (seleno)protein [Polynucleobacter finlandensis]|uniref:GDCCVxC domain-containing (seleno)protein n=1 Tax=Polynucleobacter finlandensis TaxID=1855894 RepID=UPI0034E1FD26